MADRVNRVVSPDPVKFGIYTGAPSPRLMDNPSGRGIIVNINLSNIAGVTLTVVIEALDPASGNYYTLLASAALSVAGMVTLMVYPGIAAVANVQANLPVPKQVRIRLIHSDTVTPITYSVGAAFVL